MTASRRNNRLPVYALATALAAAVSAFAWVGDGVALSTLQPPDTTTAAPPAPPNPTFANDKSLVTLANGLAALGAKRIDEARALRDSLPANSLDRHILAWAIALKGGNEVPSAEIARTARDLPGWPGMEILRRNSERALLKESPAPEAVLRAFGELAPQTPEGAIILARSQVALGNIDGARKALSSLWRTAKLDAADETAIITEFGAIVPVEDHRFRMERMLYSERAKSAGRIAKLANAEALATAWSAVLRNDPKAAKLLDAVPQEQRSAGCLFAEAQFLRKQKRLTEAAKLMAQAPKDQTALVDADAWWVERRLLSRQLLDAGQAKLAYQVAAGHAAESATNAADAEFHAGWYALRSLGDPKTAAIHFARIAEVAEGPISRSRAYYWLGRSADASHEDGATGYYEKAAAYGTTFYGQLAAAKLGRSTLNVTYPEPNDADRASFPQREAVRAVERLQAAGYPQLSDTLYLELADQITSPGELALLAVMAEKRGNHYLALKVGKIAAQRGIDIGALSHPLGAIPSEANISGSGKALAYAIARQESEFNVGAVSRAGARGLLQLMPGTAQQVAKQNGLAYSQEKLTTDPGYNATLGAAFLGQQLARFDGSYILTFAGYNAGPRRADQWIKRYGDPRGKSVEAVVDWIERIPFSETRSYVQRVMENYEVYKMRITGRYDIVDDLRHGRT
ncbi:MAG: lytic transglycosylase domain-containing protein [Rhizobiaceae bacterium]